MDGRILWGKGIGIGFERLYDGQDYSLRQKKSILFINTDFAPVQRESVKIAILGEFRCGVPSKGVQGDFLDETGKHRVKTGRIGQILTRDKQGEKRLIALDPLKDNVFELVHLNMESARLLDKNKPEGYGTAIQKLFHTCNKDIKLAVTFHTNQGRIDSFREGIKHTLIDLPGF